MKKEFFDYNPTPEQNDDVEFLKNDSDKHVEDINHGETMDSIERQILSVRNKVDAAENALADLRSTYEDAGPDQKPIIRDMITSADWALHRATQELAEALEALGVTDSD